MKAIIIVGGYSSFWPAYLGLARDLKDLTGLRAVAVPLMPWDWWKAGRAKDASNILHKVSRTVVWARRRLAADQFVFAGHSAGGLIARIYLSDQAAWGTAYSGVEHTTCLVTLGSPHCSHRTSQTGWFLADVANQIAPGAPFANRLLYRAVVGHLVRGSEDGNSRERRAHRLYSFFSAQGNVWGDGIVPVECAGLDGVETLVLDGVAHSRRVGREWYGGTKAIIRRWWPDGAGNEH
jgi:pimeloyl-ACP methyl ester carboxylesterase